MKIKRNVKAPKAPKELHSRGGKYEELWKAIEEMPVNSWIEVRFDEPITLRDKIIPHIGSVSTLPVRMKVHVVDEYTMKVGKFPAEETKKGTMITKKTVWPNKKSITRIIKKKCRYRRKHIVSKMLKSVRWVKKSGERLIKRDVFRCPSRGEMLIKRFLQS